MVFSSIEFLWLFMPVVLVAYLAVPPSWRNPVLALASLGFYVWGAHAVLFRFLGSIAFNYVAGLLIGRFRDLGDQQAAKVVAIVAVAFNLLALAFWKYTVFFVHQLQHALGWVGADVATPTIALPIGISFFTFH